MATVIHALVKDADDQDEGVVGLEEDAVAAAAGHLDSGPEVVARPREYRSADQPLHGVAKGVHIPAGLVSPPGPRGVPPNLGEIRPRDLGEDESLHRLANRASISSSVSNSITRPAATSS